MGSSLINSIPRMRVLLLAGLCAAALGAFSPEPAAGAELRFAVEADRIDAVWRQISAVQAGGQWLKNQLGADARAEFFAEIRQAVYFDTPALALLQNGGAVEYHRVWPAAEAPVKAPKEGVSLSVPVDEVAAVETATGDTDVVRSGESFEFAVRHYTAVVSSEEKHPLLGLIQRSLRPTFKEVLGQMGVEHPFALREVFGVVHQRAGFDLFHGADLFGRIAMDVAKVSRFGIDASMAVVSITPAAGVAPERIQPVEEWVRERFAGLVLQDAPLYQTAFAVLDEKLPVLGLLLQFPLIKRIGEAVLFSLMGLVALLLFWGRRILMIS